MKYLCIKPPWSHLIMYGIKDVENRRKPTKFRGRFVVVASSVYDRAGRDHLTMSAHISDMWAWRLHYGALRPKQAHFRHALGTVDLVDCVQNHPSPWAEPGKWHWVLRDLKPFNEPVPFVAGRPGLFDGPDPDESGLFKPHDGTTRRVDVRKEPADIMVTGPGKWGNPFKTWVASKPIEFFEEYARKNKSLMSDLPELKGKRLGCFCGADEPCHGDILVQLVKEVCGG